MLSLEFLCTATVTPTAVATDRAQTLASYRPVFVATVDSWIIQRSPV